MKEGIRKRLPGQSIRTKLVLLLIVLLILTIAAVWLMNIVFLPSYYEYSKVSMLSESFQAMNDTVCGDTEFAQEDALSESSLLSIEQLEANRSMNIYLFQIGNFYGNLYYTFAFQS